MTLEFTEEYKDFIGIYKNVFVDGFCEHLINEFNRLQTQGVGFYRRQFDNSDSHVKSDFCMNMELVPTSLYDFKNEPTLNFFHNGLQKCYESYANKFSILKTDSIMSTFVKAQKTSPGEAYHIWHHENGGQKAHWFRVLVYMIYLNTLEDDAGGETEFLYQKLRIKPEENTLIIWPAAFTHTHRGNTVLGKKDKYVITGWFSYC